MHRVLPALLFCTFALADTHADIVDLFASVAAGLSEDSAPTALKAFDKQMPGYDNLSASVKALLGQAEVTSSLDVLRDEGDDQHRTVELDWYMELKSKQPNGPLERRRKTVRCKVDRQGKNWRIVSFDPPDVFAPMQF